MLPNGRPSSGFGSKLELSAVVPVPARTAESSAFCVKIAAGFECIAEAPTAAAAATTKVAGVLILMYGRGCRKKENWRLFRYAVHKAEAEAPAWRVWSCTEGKT